jgi:hypothetical protein
MNEAKHIGLSKYREARCKGRHIVGPGTPIAKINGRRLHYRPVGLGRRPPSNEFDPPANRGEPPHNVSGAPNNRIVKSTSRQIWEDFQ